MRDRTGGRSKSGFGGRRGVGVKHVYYSYEVLDVSVYFRRSLC